MATRCFRVGEELLLFPQKMSLGESDRKPLNPVLEERGHRDLRTHTSFLRDPIDCGDWGRDDVCDLQKK